MRDTFDEERFAFTHPDLQGWKQNPPDRIIVHRQGNPGAPARNALQWGNRTGAFSIHTYIEDDVAFHCVPLDQQAFHANAGSAAKAAEWGFAIRTPGGGQRGDIRALGIETVDIKGGGPGQTYSLSQETRITLVLVLARQCKELGIDPLGPHAIEEHAGYGDPTRTEDLGDAIYVPDLRLDVADQMAGREPWRTVQQFAYGRAAPDDWKPAPAPPPPPDDIKKYRIIPVGEPVIEWTDKADIREIRQKVRIVRDD